MPDRPRLIGAGEPTRPGVCRLGSGVSVLGEVPIEIELLADARLRRRGTRVADVRSRAACALRVAAAGHCDRRSLCALPFDHGRMCSTNAAAIDTAIRDGILRELIRCARCGRDATG